MSYIIIGDVHGTSHWKNIIKEYKKNDDDVVIFLGDYVDSFNITPEQCLKNLAELFEYRCTTPNVYMLIGNHDYHYLRHDWDRYSGYRYDWMKAYRSILLDNYELLKVVHTFEHEGSKYICSHAGVSNTFLNTYNIPIIGINQLWLDNPSAFGFNHACTNMYGDDKRQGPLWIRPRSLLEDSPVGYKQIVGHTNLDWATTMYPHTHEEDSVTVVCTENEYGFIIL